MPDVSFTFILPVLDAAGPSFERALTSIRDQRYPDELVELIVADGGSSDATVADAERYGARVIANPNRLAEWGVKEGMLVAGGDIAVVFAADNELVGPDWLETVASLFAHDERLFAVYGRLVAGRDDPALNKYVELIQSEPMNWFLNRNLETYLAGQHLDGDGYASFDVDPTRPLIWGANGLALRRCGRCRRGSGPATSPMSTRSMPWCGRGTRASPTRRWPIATTTRWPRSATSATSGSATQSSIWSGRQPTVTSTGCSSRGSAGAHFSGPSTA